MMFPLLVFGLLLVLVAMAKPLIFVIRCSGLFEFPAPSCPPSVIVKGSKKYFKHSQLFYFLCSVIFPLFYIVFALVSQYVGYKLKLVASPYVLQFLTF